MRACGLLLQLSRVGEGEGLRVCPCVLRSDRRSSTIRLPKHTPRRLLLLLARAMRLVRLLGHGCCAANLTAIEKVATAPREFWRNTSALVPERQVWPLSIRQSPSRRRSAGLAAPHCTAQLASLFQGRAQHRLRGTRAYNDSYGLAGSSDTIANTLRLSRRT